MPLPLTRPIRRRRPHPPSRLPRRFSTSASLRASSPPPPIGLLAAACNPLPPPAPPPPPPSPRHHLTFLSPDRPPSSCRLQRHLSGPRPAAATCLEEPRISCRRPPSTSLLRRHRPGPRHHRLLNPCLLHVLEHVVHYRRCLNGQGIDLPGARYSRPHLVEFVDSEEIVISNLTFFNSPAWSIHPVYCRHANNTWIQTSLDAPLTDGIVPGDTALDLHAHQQVTPYITSSRTVEDMEAPQLIFMHIIRGFKQGSRGTVEDMEAPQLTMDDIFCFQWMNSE